MLLPKDFIEYTSALFGADRWQRFTDAMGEPASVSVRLNTGKLPAEDAIQHVKSLNAGADTEALDAITEVPWCRNAFWLSKRPNFTLDPLLHAGCYYVQEAGSMFLDNVLQHVLPTLPHQISALDLCAAPGGKSTLLRQALSEGSWLVCNEPERKRANILMENIQKQGNVRVTVTNGYARDIARAKMSFDLIVCDVPCSGEGMFRKDEGAIKEWSLQNVMRCAELQRSIIEDIWPCLKQDGILVYSTCTFNTHENEENVQWISEELGADIISIPTDEEWAIQPSMLSGFDAPVYRFIPGTTRSEGLFMAVLRKTNGISNNATDTMPTQKQLAKLHILHHGMPTGTQKGKDFIPDHALALSMGLEADAYPRCELSLDEARRYLHRETIVLPEDTPRGFIIVTYTGIPLGFVKNIGSRANNLYPKEWAIRNL